MQAAISQVLAGGGGVEDWNRLLALNTAGVCLACRYLLPGMVERGRGVVTNISSVAAVGPALPAAAP